jgi:hypothetical protein
MLRHTYPSASRRDVGVEAIRREVAVHAPDTSNVRVVIT